MIPTLIVVGLLVGVRSLIDLLPEDEMDWPSGAAVADTIGSWVGWMDPVLPLSEFAATMAPLLTIIVPTIITARATMWFYFMTPAIGGSSGD